ncbi:MAG: hypothetical protein MAG431_02464 [Chloroflexi bacterium]|nr:hypothetical protein [Chloroflexota bacterium]
MIYLDTHIVAWLYAGLVEKFNPQIKALMNDNEVFISPIVRLELQYLFEIQRVTDNANTIVEDLANRLDLKICDRDFNAVISQALSISWTRDPFDRLLVAYAGLNDNFLITKDQTILDNYPYAKW